MAPPSVRTWATPTMFIYSKLSHHLTAMQLDFAQQMADELISQRQENDRCSETVNLSFLQPFLTPSNGGPALADLSMGSQNLFNDIGSSILPPPASI